MKLFEHVEGNKFKVVKEDTKLPDLPPEAKDLKGFLDKSRKEKLEKLRKAIQGATPPKKHTHSSSSDDDKELSMGSLVQDEFDPDAMPYEPRDRTEPSDPKKKEADKELLQWAVDRLQREPKDGNRDALMQVIKMLKKDLNIQ